MVGGAVVGGAVVGGAVVGGAVVPPPVQVPLSIQTSSVPWWVAGSSPWVHHLAVYWWPFSEACWPPVKMAVAVQAGAVHPPGGGVVGGGVVGGAVVGGVVVGGAVVGGGVGIAPANCVVNFVKSHAAWATLLHVPEVVPLLSGGLHCRSRLTAQNV